MTDPSTAQNDLAQALADTREYAQRAAREIDALKDAGEALLDRLHAAFKAADLAGAPPAEDSLMVAGDLDALLSRLLQAQEENLSELSYSTSAVRPQNA